MYKYLNSPFLKYVLGIIEVIFGVALILKLLHAGTQAPFVQGWYALADSLATPFQGMFANTVFSGGGVFDKAIFSGMIIYAILVFLPVALHQKFKEEQPIAPPVRPMQPGIHPQQQAQQQNQQPPHVQPPQQ